jgi:hypothetical protein
MSPVVFSWISRGFVLNIVGSDETLRKAKQTPVGLPVEAPIRFVRHQPSLGKEK